MNFIRFIIAFFRFNRTNWRTILLCFTLALVFWLFNALNKDYTTNLNLPLTFKFDSSQYVPVKPLPNTVSMNIKGKGWNILGRSFSSYSKDVYITLKKPTIKKKIVGSTLPMLLTDQLKDLQINYIITDTLHININPWKTCMARASINPQKFTYEEGFDRLGPIHLTPGFIEIKGPKSTVDALPDSILIEVEGSDLNENFEETIELYPPEQTFLQYTPNNITVSFNVAQWEQFVGYIPLDIKNIPQKIERDSVKDSVACTFSVAATKIAEFEKMKSRLVALIDMQQLTKDGYKTVPKVIDLPEYIRLIQIDSISVKSY